MNKTILIAATMALAILTSCEYRSDKVKSLQGTWKFAIGDNKEWAKPGYDDSKWDKMYVPNKWEDEGYQGYNGFAWYRKHLSIAKKYDNTNLYLHLGRVDDVDEVYFNGVIIGGTGNFPPNFKGKYNENRRYLIPGNLIKYNADNVISVRVYDEREGGGIRNGEIGIFLQDELTVDLDLSGKWKFHLYDSINWKEAAFDDRDWKEVKVPSYYESEGFEDFDGFSWYRKKFDMPLQLKNRKLVLVMGKIDDIDQVYINGSLAGGLGDFRSTVDSINTESFWDEFRGYYLPDNIVLKDVGNVIAVRVFDSGSRGGIYKGPIGLVDQENYSKYWSQIRKKRW